MQRMLKLETKKPWYRSVAIILGAILIAVGVWRHARSR
jgi:hypothetical protein